MCMVLCGCGVCEWLFECSVCAWLCLFVCMVVCGVCMGVCGVCAWVCVDGCVCAWLCVVCVHGGMWMWCLCIVIWVWLCVHDLCGCEGLIIDVTPEPPNEAETKHFSRFYCPSIPPPLTRPVLLQPHLLLSLHSFSPTILYSHFQDMATMRKRQRILRLVLSGRIGEAVSSVNTEYPGLMERNPDLLFRLICDRVSCLCPPRLDFLVRDSCIQHVLMYCFPSLTSFFHPSPAPFPPLILAFTLHID